MSGGTRPATLCITKNGWSRWDGSVSIQASAGTGTLLCLATRSIRSYCFWRSYVGKTGTSLAAGATRATNEPLPSFHVASKKSDSLDMPFDSGDDTGPITASGSSVVDLRWHEG